MDGCGGKHGASFAQTLRTRECKTSGRRTSAMEDLVASVRVVCRSRPLVAAKPQVCEHVASFLVPPDSWTIERAIRHGCHYLALYLLERVVEHPGLRDLDLNLYVQTRIMPEAAAAGNIALLELLVSWFDCSVDPRIVGRAVACGRLGALEWLVDRAIASLPSGEHVRAFTMRIFPDYLIKMAACGGYLEMLHWINERIGGLGGTSAEQVLVGAAESGHMQIVEWVQPNLSRPLTIPSVLRIVRSGHTDIVKFLYTKSILPLTPGVLDAVAGCGYLDLLEWMYDRGGDECTFASMRNDAWMCLDRVQWLHFKGFGCTTRAMASAVRNGHLDVVKFLRTNRFTDKIAHNETLRRRCEECSGASVDDAAARGHLEMIKWLTTNCPSVQCTRYAMDNAAANGFLDIVRFLHENRTEGCSKQAMDCAAKNGFLEVVEWLHLHRYEGCTANAIDYAAKYGHLEVVKFLHFHRTEGCTTWAMDFAAENGHLDIVEFLHFHRSEGCTTRAMDKAAANGHLEIVKFLHWHRTEGCTTRAMDYAGNVEVAQYLSENRSEGFTGEALIVATGKGDVRMREWLRMRVPIDMWTPQLVDQAAMHGNIEALMRFAKLDLERSAGEASQ